MHIKELTNEEFKNFANNYSYNSVYQTLEYALTMNKQGYSSRFVGLIDNNNIVAASLILIKLQNKFKYAYAPKGFLIDYNNFELLSSFTSQLKQYLKKLDVVAIKLCPPIIKSTYDSNKNIIYENPCFDTIFNDFKKLGYYHFGFNNYFEALKPRFETIIELDKSENELFNNIKKEFKTKIRSANKNGIEIGIGNETTIKYMYPLIEKKYPRDITYFENLYNYFDRDKNVDIFFAKLNTNKYLKEMQDSYDIIDKKRTIYEEMITNQKFTDKQIDKKLNIDLSFEQARKKLLNATNIVNEKSNMILAAAFIIKYKDTVYLMIDGYDKKYKNLNAKHLLVWKLIKYYKSQGYKYLNIGGISNLNVDSKFKGLNEFKCNFNPIINEYLGDLELVTSDALYFMYRKIKPLNNIIKKKSN